MKAIILLSALSMVLPRVMSTECASTGAFANPNRWGQVIDGACTLDVKYNNVSVGDETTQRLCSRSDPS